MRRFRRRIDAAKYNRPPTRTDAMNKTLLIPLLLLTTSPLAAQETVAELLPPDTQVYLDIPDYQAMRAGLSTSTAGRFFAEPSVEGFFGEFDAMVESSWADLKNMAEEQTGLPATLLTSENIHSIEAGAWFGGVSTETRLPRFSAAMRIGTNEELGQTVAALLQAVFAATPYLQATASCYYKNGGLFVTIASETTEGSFATSAAYQAGRERLWFDGAQVFAHLDSSALCRMGVEAGMQVADLSGTAPDPGMAIVDALFEELGFYDLGAVAVASGWVDGDSITTSTMPLPETRRGLWALMGATADTSLVKFVPANANSFSLTPFNARALWELCCEGVMAGFAAAPEEFQPDPELVEAFSGERREATAEQLGAIGNEVFTYSTPSTGGMMGMGGGGGGSFVKVVDIPVARAVLDEWCGLLGDLLENSPAPVQMEHKTVKIRSRNEEGEMVTTEGGSYYQFSLRLDRLPPEAGAALGMTAGMFSPAVGITDDGWMVLSITSTTVRAAMRKGVPEQTPSITSNPEASAFLAGLPEEVTSANWSDPRPGASGVWQSLGMLPMMVQGMPVDIPFDLTSIPPAEALVDNMRAAENYHTLEENVLVTHCVGNIGVADVVAAIEPLAVALVPYGFLARASAAEPSFVETHPDGAHEFCENCQELDCSGECSVDLNAAAFREIGRLQAGVVTYQIEQGRLPATLDELTAATETYSNGFLPNPARGLVPDPWGNPFVYRVDGEDFALYSAGPDGIDNGGEGDDVVL